MASLPADKDIVFHNHQGQGFRYAYPLIQYKVIEGKAAVMFIGEGITHSGTLISACNKQINIGHRSTTLAVERVIPANTNIEYTDDPLRYSIHDWLPLNEQNIPRFQSLASEDEQYEFLSQILTGNILSFAKGTNIFFNSEVQCEVAQLSPFRLVESKHVQMMSFDAEFICNVSLPDYIGLGKHASFGYGQIKNIQ